MLVLHDQCCGISDPLLVTMQEVLICNSNAEILVDPFLVPHGQHYISTPYSVFLPAPVSPPLSHQHSPKHPQIPVFFLLAFIHIPLTPPLLPVTPFSSCWSKSSWQVWVQTPLWMPLAALSHSGCFSPVSCITCVQSHLCHTAPLSNEHPQQPLVAADI